jgi:hypothetical protein
MFIPSFLKLIIRFFCCHIDTHKLHCHEDAICNKSFLYNVNTGNVLKIACKIETGPLRWRIFHIYTVQWTVCYVFCSVQWVGTQLDVTSAVILAMTYGSCGNLHSVSLRLRSLKVDVHLNKKRKQDVSGFHLPACIKHNKYLEAVLALYDCCMSMPSLDVLLNPRAFLENASTVQVKDLFFRYL